MVVPEFPASRGEFGACNPLSPGESMSNDVGDSCKMATPSFCRQAIVLWQSAAGESLETLHRPLASSEKMSARCEMDLSPGTCNVPFSIVFCTVHRNRKLTYCKIDGGNVGVVAVTVCCAF